MIVQGLLILLVILVIANFALGMFNAVSPPCSSASEYFQGAKRMPDGAAAGLGSIPTHTWQDYVGAKRVATGIPGVIGLTSYNNQKNGYIGNTQDSLEGYVNPVVHDMAETDASDCQDRHQREVSEEATNAIDAVLQPGKKGKAKTESETDVSAKAGSLTEFEVSMEGIMSKNIDKSSLRGKHMSLAHQTARDGYTSRPGDKI